jgi:hypothetical protein
MTKNMGNIDRGVRVGLALLVAILIIADIISGPFAWVLGVLAVVFVGTSFISYCPLYVPFKITTRK